MTELTDDSGAFGYGESILVGERVRLRGVRDDDLPTLAMRVIVEYGFREMGLHRIQLSVAPFNPAGIRAYQKAGFVQEGRYRESVLHDGRWYDEVLMSILDHEWAARRSPGL
jgi:RimJ/RimL family protein N-acetyltransferase